ncbi:preprotein translocase subunit SecG [Asticcacaulis solisilvae]|uniref:preprotein translocase subunit SecG n=1 Tax=Asticcacaulis solisilvae TaxID=1217274 RepID=UPI003FD84714
MLFYILLTIQILICLSLAGLVLIQRSEGGALGMGGGPSGFMSARGAGNLLTRLTAIFGILFFANSIGLTIVGNLTSKQTSAADQVDASKLPVNPLAPQSAQPPAATAPAAPASAAPSLNNLPLAGAEAPSSSSSAATKSVAPAMKSNLAPAGSLGPSLNLSMPKQTTTDAVNLSKTSSSSASDTPKPAAPKPAHKASASSASSVHSTSAAPSSSASTTPAATSPASSQ